MKNKAKILVIIGVIVIIGLPVIGVVLFNRGIEMNYESGMLSDPHILFYNAQFETYTGEHIRSRMILDLLSKVKKNNISYKDNMISIEYKPLSGDIIASAYDNEISQKAIDDYIVKDKYYKVELTKFTGEGFISRITISQKL